MKRYAWMIIGLAFGTITAEAGTYPNQCSVYDPRTIDPSYDGEESQFLQRINDYRAQNGKQPLQLNKQLSQSAEWFAKDMAVNNYFSLIHQDRFGGDPFDRMSCFNYTTGTRGENIIAGTLYASASQAINGWKGSPGHNSNMLDSRFNAIGIARHFNSGSTYGWYWATTFGSVTDVPPDPVGNPPTIANITINGSSEKHRSFQGGTTLQLGATVSDPDGLGDIARVEFINSYTCVSASNCPALCTTTNAPNGQGAVTCGWQTPVVTADTSFNLFARVVDRGNRSANTANPAGDVPLTVTAAPVNIAPSFNTHPQTQTVNPGQPVNLTVTASGTPPPSYQWEESGNNSDWSAINGATGTSYSFTASVSKYYRCRATNVVSSVASNSALVTVNPPANRPPTVSVLTPANNAVVTWRTADAAAAISLTANAADPDGDALNVIYNRVSSPAGLIGQSSDSGNQFGFTWNITESSVYVFNATVNDGKGGTATSGNVTITVRPEAPTIQQQPSSVTLQSGEGTTFRVGVAGHEVTYQWQRKKSSEANFSNVSGATSDSIQVQNATANDNGDAYRCLVTNGGGNSLSNTATLTVQTTPVNNPPTASIANNGSTASEPGIVRLKIEAHDPDGDSTITKVELRNDGEALIHTFPATGGTYSYEQSNMPAGRHTYKAIVSDGEHTVASSYITIEFAPRPANQTPTVSMRSPAHQAVITWRTSDASLAIPLTANASDPDGDALTVSYNRVSAPAGAIGQSTDAGNHYGFNWTLNQSAVVVINASVSDGKGGTATSSNITFTVKPEAPTIQEHPSNRTIQNGQTAVFTVGALGHELTYQWQRKKTTESNFSNVSGATQATIQVDNASSGENGNSYRCLVTNGGGNVLSNAATLTVQSTPTNQPPTVRTPASASPNPTTNGRTNLTVRGDDPDDGEENLIYTWGASRDGFPVRLTYEPSGLNGTKAGKVIDAVLPSLGTYKFVVTIQDPHGAIVTSEVTVVSEEAQSPAPRIDRQPASVEIWHGQQAALSIAASGKELRYQWKVRNSNGEYDSIPGATSSSFTTDILLSAQGTRRYICAVSNTGGSVVSDIAVVSVKPLPPPRWSPPESIRSNGTLSLDGFPTGTGTQFTWAFTLDTSASSAGRRAPGASAPAATSSIVTYAPSLSLSSLNLPTGNYTVNIQVFDPLTNTMVGTLNSTMAIQSSVSNVTIKAYPNPWRKGPHTAIDVTLSGIPAGSTAKVFTMSGRFVRQLDVVGTTALWNRKNDSGEGVASGVYIYVVEDPSGELYRGKIVLIQ